MRCWRNLLTPGCCTVQYGGLLGADGESLVDREMSALAEDIAHADTQESQTAQRLKEAQDRMRARHAQQRQVLCLTITLPW